MMKYNECNYCGAGNGRAGLLWTTHDESIKDACENCYQTLKTGSIVLHTHLIRTDEEINKTINLLNNQPNTHINQ